MQAESDSFQVSHDSNIPQYLNTSKYTGEGVGWGEMPKRMDKEWYFFSSVSLVSGRIKE